MKRQLRLFITAIGFCLMWTAILTASEQKIDQKTQVAKVNDVIIFQKDFDNSYNNYVKNFSNKMKSLNESQLLALKNEILENLINTELLYQASQKEGIKIDEGKFNSQWSKIQNKMENDARYKAEIDEMNISENGIKENLRRQMTLRKLVTDKFEKRVVISEDEVNAYYESNKKSFYTPEQVKASHILIKVNPEADEAQKSESKKQVIEVQKQIEKGEDFAVLARKFSQCPSKTKGGDLGYFGRGKMVKPFEDTAFRLKVGEVSDIVTTQFGYHLIKVTEKKEESITPLDEVKKRIERFLIQNTIGKEIEAYLRAEKKKSVVERYLK